MDPSQISQYVSLLVALSVASERLVEIVKGMIPWLATQNPNPGTEARRKAVLQLLAAAAGIVTALLASTTSALGGAIPKNPWAIVALGLLSSGGSGLWNGVLDYVKAAKDLKQNQLQPGKQT